MTFEVAVAGRPRHVAVERVAGGERRYRVTIDGRTRLVDLYALGPSMLSLVFADETPRSSHEVAVVENGAPGSFAVSLRGAVVELTVAGGRYRRRGAARGARAGGGVVTAPMPGRVVRVLVAPGDEVKERQPLVVVEAMKMENELRAPVAGRVIEVAVEPGASVDGGRTLVRIE